MENPMNTARYLEAESTLFADAGIEPTTHWIELRNLGCRARVLAVGEGPPVVFFHGGPNAAATFAYVAGSAKGQRCLLVDRPGCGLSPPPAEIPGKANLPTYVVQLVRGIIDGLQLERVRLVGSSFSGYAVLRAALELGNRVEDITLLGCPAFVPGWTGPSFANLLRTPVLGRILMALPASEAAVRLSLKQFGHGASLADERIQKPMLDWILSWQRDTDTLRNDATMIRRCGTWLGGFDPGLDLTSAELQQIKVPVHLAFGSDDPVGGAAVGKRLKDMLPVGTLEVLKNGGHLPWLDDFQWAASQLVRKRK